MAYHESGSGVPVVFIHGAWVDYRLFKPYSQALSERFRLVLVSLRHHYPERWDGKSEPVSFRRHGSDLAGLIRALGLGKVHLIGQSMGGLVAVEVARAAPELLRSLVLVDPAGPAVLLGDEMVARVNDMATRRSQAIRDQLEGEAGRIGAAAFGWNAGAGAGSFEKFSSAIQQIFADNIGTMAATPNTSPPGLECGQARSFGFPVLLTHGERSPKFYLDLGAALRKCRSGIAAPVVVPAAGHNMHADNPAFFNQAVIEFFANN